MSASDPMFPFPHEQHAYYGCSKLLYAMIHAPAEEILRMQQEVKHGCLGIMEARRVWAEALIKESEK